METQNIHTILRIISNAIQGENFVWRLDGSANLKVQGVDTSVKDIDIDTTDDGIDIFKEVLKEHVVKDFYSEKIEGRSLVCNINGYEVEINSYGEGKFDMFDKTEMITWKDLNIPILPLKYAKKFYRLIDRQEKVDLITKYLKGQPASYVG